MSKRFTYYGALAALTYFTDLFGVPAIGASVRKLNSVVTNSVRVRRSSNNNELSIAFDGTLPDANINESDLTTFVGANNGFVARWIDQQTTNNDLVQTTASNQLTLVSSGTIIRSNGIAALQGATDKGFKIDTNIALGSNIWLFFTLDVSDTAPVQVLYENTTNYNATNGTLIIYITGGNLILSQRTDTSSGGGYCQVSLPISTGRQVLTVNLRSGQTQSNFARLWINGTSQSVTLHPTFNQNSISFINTDSYVLSRAGSVIGFRGKAQEILLYNGDKASQRAAMETNMKTYYGIL